jgi:CDP-diacylglycerol---glycerol-3-phosphate 3-phosphatidyltransferase
MQITYLRIALIPCVMGLILAGDSVDYAYVIAGSLFAIAAVTDFIDGYLARRWAATTTLGSFMDTTADKLLVSGALIALVAVDRASPWAATIIIGRELMILGLRGLIAVDGTVMAPSMWGKAKAAVQFAAILLAIVRFDATLGPLFIDEWAMWAAVVVTVVSGAEYLARFSGVLRSSTPSR